MMRNLGTVYFDIDGVLLDYTNAFLRYVGKEGAEVTDYNLSVLFDKPQHCWDAMRNFSESPYYANLPLLEPDLPTYLHALRNSGYTVKALTQVSGDVDLERVRFNRILNLTHHFGPAFDGILFTSRGECKLRLIRNIHYWNPKPEDIYLIEDNPVLLERAFIYPKITTLARKHPYNEKWLGNVQAFNTTTDAITKLIKGATQNAFNYVS